jgi:hypothetical protein
MKAILVDDMQSVKIIEPGPEGFNMADYFIPCACGKVVLHDYSVDGECFECTNERASHKHLTELGWSYEHPGYWTKNFGDRITVIAGTGEYRMDFTFCSADHDMGYGPDWCIDLERFSDKTQEILDRGCFTAQEFDELELVQVNLYRQKTLRQTHGRGNWCAGYGELSCPDGMEIYHESGERNHIHIDKEMLFDLGVDEEMSQQQADTFCMIAAVLMAILADYVD